MNIIIVPHGDHPARGHLDRRVPLLAEARVALPGIDHADPGQVATECLAGTVVENNQLLFRIVLGKEHRNRLVDVLRPSEGGHDATDQWDPGHG